jgi:hypothetical protein
MIDDSRLMIWVGRPRRTSLTGGTRPGHEARVRLCKTKPISGGDIPHHSTIPLFHHSNRILIVRNKPKLGHPGVCGERCRGSCTNKPNLAGRPLRPAASALRGPVVQTNPICPRRMGRRGRGWSLLRQTNPIFRFRIADCGLGDRPAASGLGRAIAPNKPNSWVTGARARGTHGRDAHATERLAAPARTRLPRQTNPISRQGRVGRGLCARGRELLYKQKQSQFPAMAGGTRDECAKRTQFRGVGQPDTPLFQYSIIPPFQSLPVAPNEANSRRWWVVDP